MRKQEKKGSILSYVDDTIVMEEIDEEAEYI